MSDKWREIWHNLLKGNKQILIMCMLALFGLALIVYNPGKGTRPKTEIIPPPGEQINSQADQPEGMAGEEKELSGKLESMLEQISGVGDVRVSVRLASSTDSNFALNLDGGEKTTREEDQSGGSRVTTETNKTEQLVLVRGPQGSEKPVIENEIAPRIAGIMVVAQGATTPEVRARVFQAVQVAMGVAAHKVIVLPMEEVKTGGG